MTTNAIIDAALKLSDVERRLIADRLWESISDEADEFSEEEFRAELRRRVQEASESDANTVDWADIRDPSITFAG